MRQPLTITFPKEDMPKPVTITVRAYYVFWWLEKKADKQLMQAVGRLQNVEGVFPEGEGYRLELKPTSLPIAERVKTRLLELLEANNRRSDRVIVRS